MGEEAPGKSCTTKVHKSLYLFGVEHLSLEDLAFQLMMGIQIFDSTLSHHLL